MMLRIKFVYKYFDGKFVSSEYIDGDLRSKKLKKDIRQLNLLKDVIK